MARIRSLHPGFWTDEANLRLSAECPMALLVLQGLWGEADDHGLFEWKPYTLKTRILPAAAIDFGALLSALADADAIKKVVMNGRELGAIRNFMLWQRPRRPTFVHPIDDETLKYVNPRRGNSDNVGNDDGSGQLFPDDDGKVSTDEGGRRKDGEEEGEKKKGGEGAGAPPRPRVASRLADDWSPSEDDVKSAYDDGLDESEVRREFAKFKDFWRAKPGKDGMKLDWNATFRNWMRRAADDKRQRANGRVQQGQGRARH